MSAECRRDSNAVNLVTVWIGLFGFFLLFQAWEACPTLALALPGDMADWSGRGQRRWALIWRLLVLPFLLLPLLARRRWAWASVHGILQVYVITGLLGAGVTVVAMARRASVLPGGDWAQELDLFWLPDLGYWLGVALLPLPLCLAFKRLAPEFGLDPRKAWLSLAREGGPAILITAVLECLRLGPALGRPF